MTQRGSRSWRLLVTSEQSRSRFLVVIEGTSIWLPVASFELLLQLYLARELEATPYTRADAVNVYRLRSILGDALGVTARQMIETGMRSTYRLSPHVHVEETIRLADLATVVDMAVIHGLETLRRSGSSDR